MFSVNLKWTKNLPVWGEGRFTTVGKDSKTRDKGTHTLFVRSSEHKSSSVHMWDPTTMRVVVARDVIWLKRLHFQPDDVTGVLEVDTAEDIGNNCDMPEQMILPLKLGGKVTGSDPVVTEPTHSGVTRLG